MKHLLMNLVIVNNMIFYINSINFSTATTVYSDALLNTVAPDGYYSYQGFYRRQVSGKLTDLVACPGTELDPFDYIIVTYQYNPPIGQDYDLDTLTTFRYPTSTLAGSTSSNTTGFIPGTGVVGCGASTNIPIGSNYDTAYIYFGGDDVGQSVDGSFGESVVINFKNLENSGTLTSNNIIAELFSGWHSGTSVYPISIKYETFIGGVISKEIVGGITTNRFVSTGTVVAAATISNPINIITGSCSSGVDIKRNVASISYNTITASASINFIEY